MKRVRIATRGSALAVAQSAKVARDLEQTLHCETELVRITTSGDRIQDRPLAQIGGKGLFIKEIEEALLDGRADLAIHSAKDLPAALLPGLVLAAFPRRADPRDAWISRDPERSSPEVARSGARIGTGSVRRASQLLSWRPDLQVVPLRGNVDTRLRKLEEESLDAVILACAGLERLGLEERIHARIEPELLLPAVGQGTLALQVRRGDSLEEALRGFDHKPTRVALAAERAFLKGLDGDCSVPLAALGESRPGGRLRLRTLVASPDGSRVIRADLETPAREAQAAGARAAREVLSKGGAGILAALRGSPGP